MKPPEAVFRGLVLQWLDKAERDFEAAEQLLAIVSAKSLHSIASRR